MALVHVFDQIRALPHAPLMSLESIPCYRIAGQRTAASVSHGCIDFALFVSTQNDF